MSSKTPIRVFVMRAIAQSMPAYHTVQVSTIEALKGAFEELTGWPVPSDAHLYIIHGGITARVTQLAHLQNNDIVHFSWSGQKKLMTRDFGGSETREEYVKRFGLEDPFRADRS